MYIESGGKKYKLAFTRKSLVEMESDGFDISKIESSPVTQIPLLIAGAFKTHNPDVDIDKAVNIYSGLGDKGKFLEALSTMYGDAINSIFADNEKGNATWGMSK